MKNSEVKRSEYLFYGIGGAGKGVLGAFVSLFALIYFTDAVGISPAIGGAIITVSKIAVMLLLPFAGIKMDGFHSRFGRFRPFIFLFSFLIGIITALLFISPTFYGVRNMAVKSFLCFIAYLLWEAGYNLHDVPFWSLASVVSKDEQVRASFLSIANVVTTVGGALPVLAVPFLTDNYGDEKGYLIGGLIFGLGGGIVASTAFFKIKERIPVHQEKVAVKDSFKALIDTKPLLIFDAALLLAATVFAAQEVSTYAGKYLYASQDGFILFPGGEKTFLPDELFLTVLIVLIGGGSAIGEAIFPLFFKKCGMKKSIFIFSIAGSALCVIMYLLGYDRWGKVSFVLFLLFYLLIGILGGLFESLKSNLIPECADYSEWKTGVRRDGTFFSVQVMVSQLIESVPVLAVAAILQICGYGRMTDGDLSSSVKNGIFIAATLVPAAGMLLALIPAAFYSYTGANREKIKRELEINRKETEK